MARDRGRGGEGGKRREWNKGELYYYCCSVCMCIGTCRASRRCRQRWSNRTTREKWSAWTEGN